MNMKTWRCKFCRCDALVTAWPQWQFVKCLVCLRIEGYESAARRNVEFCFIGHVPTGYALALSNDFFTLLMRSPFT